MHYKPSSVARLVVLTATAAAAAAFSVHVASAEQAAVPAACAQIVAVLDQGGGALSPEEVATKTGTDVETVRNCTDLWRRTMKDAPVPTGVRAKDQAVPAGCAQIVAVLDQTGGSLSPEEVAKKTSTDVETVRNCTDLWRSTMKGGAHQ
jgi:phage FluMu protein gp41